MVRLLDMEPIVAAAAPGGARFGTPDPQFVARHARPRRSRGC